IPARSATGAICTAAMPPSAAASAAAARMAARRAASLRATFSVRRYAMGNQPRRQQMNYDSGRSNRLPWPHRAPGGIVARKSTDKPNGRTHARIAVALGLDRASCRRGGPGCRAGEDPRELDRGAVGLDAVAPGEAGADEEQRQDLSV